MSYLSERIAPITVALVASVVTWLFGGARGDLVVAVVPWLLLIMFEVLVCFPERRRDESIYMARARVWRELRRSGLLWTSVALLALMLVPFFNVG